MATKRKHNSRKRNEKRITRDQYEQEMMKAKLKRAKRLANSPTPEEAAIRTAHINQAMQLAEIGSAIFTTTVGFVTLLYQIKGGATDIKKLKIQKEVNESATALVKSMDNYHKR